jgi:hypothetical protein
LACADASSCPSRLQQPLERHGVVLHHAVRRAHVQPPERGGSGNVTGLRGPGDPAKRRPPVAVAAPHQEEAQFALSLAVSRVGKRMKMTVGERVIHLRQRPLAGSEIGSRRICHRGAARASGHNCASSDGAASASPAMIVSVRNAPTAQRSAMRW